MAFNIKQALLPEGKAIPAHPALQGSDPISVYSPGAARKDSKLSQAEAARHLDSYGGTQAIDWVMDCVRLYADTTSTAEWHLEKDGKKLLNRKTFGYDGKLAPQGLVDLLEQPNPFMDYAELVDLLIIDLLLVGNAYWFKWRMNEEGHPLALYRLSPAHVKIIPSSFGPKGYEYNPPGAREPLTISPDEIMHLRLPNPHSAFYGMGLIKGGGRAYDVELALTDTMASYYENKADPSMIISSERRVPRDVFNKLRAQLRARVSGSRKTGELLVLEAGLKASTLTPSARDALYQEASTMSRDRIFSQFRTSPVLFGLLEQGGAGNKVADARREFDTKTMRPFMDKLQKRITHGLVSAWGLDYKIDYRYIMPVEELVKLAGDFAVTPGVKVREIREFLGPVGIHPSTGNKEIDEMVLNLPGEELDKDGQGGFADRPIGSEAGRPPKGENTKPFPQDGNLPPNSKVRQGKGLDDLFDRLDKIETKAVEQHPPDPLERERDEAVDDAATYIKQQLQDTIYPLERALLDHAEGKALGGRIRKSEAWITFANRIRSVLEAGAQRAISAAVIHSGSDAELDYDELAANVIDRSSNVDHITKTLRDSIVKKLADVEDREEANKIIRESVVAWRENQSETIALTEAMTAYNEGTLTVAELAGSTEVFVTDGRDHDEPCQEADGQTWSIDRARENRLEHPRCRRAFLPITV